MTVEGSLSHVQKKLGSVVTTGCPQQWRAPCLMFRKRLVQWLQQVVHDSGGLPVSFSGYNRLYMTVEGSLSHSVVTTGCP